MTAVFPEPPAAEVEIIHVETARPYLPNPDGVAPGGGSRCVRRSRGRTGSSIGPVNRGLHQDPGSATGFRRPLSQNHGEMQDFVRVQESPISPISVEGCKLIDIHSGHHGTGERRVSAWRWRLTLV